MPIKERIRVFSGFVAAYDPSTKNPIWVLEHIDKNSASGGAQRKNLFYEDAVCSIAAVVSFITFGKFLAERRTTLYVPCSQVPLAGKQSGASNVEKTVRWQLLGCF
jgi:hypothetical protein